MGMATQCNADAVHPSCRVSLCWCKLGVQQELLLKGQIPQYTAHSAKCSLGHQEVDICLASQFAPRH